MHIEGLAVGQPFVISARLSGFFTDVRPATLVRKETTRDGHAYLLARDETNGKLRAFEELGGSFVAVTSDVGKHAVLDVISGPHASIHDVVEMHHRAVIQSCDLCGEEDVFGVRAHGRSRCGRCVSIDECVGGDVGGDVGVGGSGAADADLVRALIRAERAIEDHPSMARVLAQLDGLRPWHVMSECFAPPSWGCEDLLPMRESLVRWLWANSNGSEVGRTFAARSPWALHPWAAHDSRVTFTVGADTIVVAATNDVIATRVAVDAV